jgi:hypothetical protein
LRVDSLQCTLPLVPIQINAVTCGGARSLYGFIPKQSRIDFHTTEHGTSAKAIVELRLPSLRQFLMTIWTSTHTNPTWVLQQRVISRSQTPTDQYRCLARLSNPTKPTSSGSQTKFLVQLSNSRMKPAHHPHVLICNVIRIGVTNAALGQF